MKEITVRGSRLQPSPEGRTVPAERLQRLLQLPGRVKAWALGVPDRVKAWAQSLPGRLQSWACQLPGRLLQWAKHFPGRVVGWVKQEIPYWKAGLRRAARGLHHAAVRQYTRQEAAVLLAAATVLGVTLCYCMIPISQKLETYLLVEGTQTYAVHGKSDFSYESTGLRVLDTQAGRDAQILLQGDQTVTVLAADGTRQTVTTRLETVGNLLRRLGLSTGEGEMIVTEQTEEGMTIRICADYVATRYRDVNTAYEVIRRPNYRMEKGTEQVVQEGKQGTVTKTYEDTYRMGELVGSELVHTTDDNSVPQIIEYGTLVKSVAAGDTIASVEFNSDGSGLLIFHSGDSMTFSKRENCIATAYSGGWGTASGMPLGEGTVAVDTSVFPFGTRFFIQTTNGKWVYGMGTAKDRGSSIRGHKIDLWFNSYRTACNWGLRNVYVYVLN